MVKKYRDTKTTLEEELLAGNSLFDVVTHALGMDAVMSRRLIADSLKTIASSPRTVTIQEMGALFPEVDRRIRLVLPPERADRAIARLRETLLEWNQD